MNEFQMAILVQVQSYVVVVAAVIIVFSLLLRGFLGKYLRVRTSFGRFLMVKVRTPMRDYFEVGIIDEGFLIYKHKGSSDRKKEPVKLSVPKDYIYTYRCLGVTWVDVDEEKNAISYCDYSSVTGFDAKKFGDLVTRALMRPSIADNAQKILLVALGAVIILLIISLYFGYKNFDSLQKLPSIISSMKGTVAQAAGI